MYRGLNNIPSFLMPISFLLRIRHLCVKNGLEFEQGSIRRVITREDLLPGFQKQVTHLPFSFHMNRDDRQLL